MKTKVKIIATPQHANFKKGERGYIDGYVRGFGDRPVAIVVVANRIDFVALNCLEVIETECKH